MNKARNLKRLQAVILLLFFGVLACGQFQSATPTAIPTATLVPTVVPTNTMAPLPISKTLLTLPELNSVFDNEVWQKEATPHQLQLVPDIAIGIEGSTEQAASSWAGTVAFNSDSVIQIHIQKWKTTDEAANTIELYESAHDVNFEKNLEGSFIRSSNAKELSNGKIIVDSLGIDQFNPIVYTAIIRHSNISFTIQAVFPRTNEDYAVLIKKYVDMQIAKLQKSGYR